MFCRRSEDEPSFEIRLVNNLAAKPFNELFKIVHRATPYTCNPMTDVSETFEDDSVGIHEFRKFGGNSSNFANCN